MRPFRFAPAAVAIAMALGAGCAGSGAQERARTGSTTITSATSLSDEEVAAVLATTHVERAEEAQLAAARAAHPDVRGFAEHVLADHNDESRHQTSLLSDLGLTARETPTSRDLAREGDATIGRLRAADDAAFDRTYLNAVIASSDRFLLLARDLLVPNTRRPELRAALETTRGQTEGERAEAKRLLAALPP